MEAMGVLKSSRNTIRDAAKRHFPWAVARSRTLKYFAVAKANADHGAGAEVGRRCEWRVVDGPFRGMQYPWWLCGSVLPGPKLLGCYERELHATFERVIERKYTT